MRASILFCAVALFAAHSLPAQGTPAKAPATKAPPTAAAATSAPQNTKAPTATKQGTKGITIAPPAPETAAPRTPPIMREVFDYDRAGRRDPFVSLLTTTELRPSITDLRLVGILHDPSGQRPIAVMRDLTTNTQYRVTTGVTLGRMTVSLIKRRAVFFTIEEFGLNRTDSLVLGDTTRARAR